MLSALILFPSISFNLYVLILPEHCIRFRFESDLEAKRGREMLLINVKSATAILKP